MIGRAFRMQARSLLHDAVLLWMLVAAFAMSVLVAAGAPPEVAEAPPSSRAAILAPVGVVVAVYGAVLAAVYGSFRYTVDRRDGVLAQRLMLQRRPTVLLTRVPSAAVGGAFVSLAAVVGAHAAFGVALGGLPIDGSAVGRTLLLGAVAGVYGLGVGLVVQSHLVALFIAPMSLAAGLLVVAVWPAMAAHLPLLTLLEALDFDVSAAGLAASDRLDRPVAILVSTGWMLFGLLGGGALFLLRDLP
ncbi:hypothetical protein [Microbacterium hydrocarbonoxydans]|uniref:hypothetical protein n=1 Tax=Microbacterium hydrocarbonoxydans TaxID=273678 RepID=UPI00203FBBF2|nr:hypothetical protein [Microbacterium hydrocarbonoxydans]MCM3779988.1 hypothetical protein [Microbacterium hydrocarbonoxydans]